MVPATIRKMHAPNHEAAVFEVSGSPDENLPYTLTPPIKPDHRADGVDQFRRGVEIELVTMLVASLMPERPLPCAKAEDAARRRAAEKRKCFFVIDCSSIVPDGWIVRPAGRY